MSKLQTNAIRHLGSSSDNIVLDSSGQVRMPNQPSFNVYNPGSNVTGNLVFGATNHNIGSCYNTSTGRFTAPVAGRYFFYTQLLMSPTGGGDVRFDINGSNTTSIYGESDESGTYKQLSLGCVFNLNLNDYVQVNVFGGATCYGGSYSSFTGYLIG